MPDSVLTCDSPFAFAHLVWEHDGRVHVNYQQAAFVAARFGIPAEIPAHARR